MKTGRNITELAQELNRRQSLKKDFVADTRSMYIHPDGQTLELAPEGPERGGDRAASTITHHMHRQMATWAGIPAKYYDHMLETNPALLSMNLNQWLVDPHRRPAANRTRNGEPRNTGGIRRMIRTLESTGRAFLSDRYRRIDNEQVAQAALQPLLDLPEGQVKILSSEVTDNRLYIQASFPELQSEAIKLDDPVQAGLIISNSEIGLGSLSIRPILYRLVCFNGMVVPKDIEDGSLRRNHVGRRVEAHEDHTLFSSETLEADDKALMLKVRDTIRSLADQEQFERTMQTLRERNEGTQVQDPSAAVDKTLEVLQLPDTRRTSLLESLIQGGDYSRWGLANAVTAQAHRTEDYDTSVEMEELGGRIFSLNEDQWERIAHAEAA